MARKRWMIWAGWGASVWCGGGVAAALFFGDSTKPYFLPGQTTHGHHQIELKCSECHTPFGGVKDDACNRCHAAELAAVRDSHPKSKFTDPRNAELLTHLDAARCVTCHREHVPHVTQAMGVTQPPDYCLHCHAEIAEERPSHKGMAFDTCATAGCHNFHDNTALYEDFLAKHLHDAPTRADGVRLLPVSTPSTDAALTATAATVPAGVALDAAVVSDWAASAHAHGGVNCVDCHQGGDAAAAWTPKPDHASCARCHASEAEGFLASRHGMRLAAGLSPMTPAQAVLPMRADAAHREMSCNACHSAHRHDTRRAAVDACLACHDDDHSRAYLSSPHYALWQAELSGAGAPGSGVSCATCHLPGEMHRENGRDVIRVQHNQNANLRPNEKMIRSVCQQCHGLGFAIDALADRPLIDRNFTGQPAAHVESLDLVLRRLTERQQRTTKPQ
ncbi:MAG TPA: cytochrome c3 family protein [Opitutaceae bacterium]